MSFYDKFPTRNRTFNRDPSNHSKFVEDLRKELENDRENSRMFDFDQDFNNFFPSRPNLRSRFGQHHPGFFTRNTNFDGPTHSSGASTSSADSSGNSSSGERVIPIHVCTDDDQQSSPKPSTADSTAPTSSSSSSKQPPQQQQQQADNSSSSNSNQKSYSTQRNNTAEMPRVKELQRNQRAQSAPPDPNPHVNMTECGGGQSKKSTNIRTIPIQVESGKQQQTRSQQQKQKQQPNNCHENSTAAGGSSSNNDDGHQPQPPKKPILDPLQKISIVAEQVKELAEKVNKFDGSNGKTKEYLYLDEMLTRLLIQLDDVEVEGRDDIRQARRECIKSIQKCINDLEVKLQGDNNTKCQEGGGGGEEEGSVAPMEEDSNSEEKSNEIIPENNNPVVPMFIDETNGAGNQEQGDQQLLLEKSSSNSSNINTTVNDNKNTESKNEEPKPPKKIHVDGNKIETKS